MLDRTSPIPLHLQLEEIIQDKLDSDTFPPGSRFPSESELCSKYGISRMTARNVVSRFVQEGVLKRIPGKGTFVSEPKIEAGPLSYEGIRAQLERQGYEVVTKLLGVEIGEGKNFYHHKLLVPADEKIYCIKRLRFVKGQPFSIHESFVPVSLAPGLEKLNLIDEQLCVILNNNYDFLRAKVYEELESIAANREEADLLNLKVGHHLLLLKDTIVDKSGTPFEYAKIIFRGDRIKLRLEF
ncbi:MAG: GntR family transcriptional regulator [Ruminococcaceae bacterium]|nr:GntR family transcriptional regulator [Oscillospiraceae bacterium]